VVSLIERATKLPNPAAIVEAFKSRVLNISKAVIKSLVSFGFKTSSGLSVVPSSHDHPV